ncbi:BglG family transcription antiterminator [Enterococcus sp. LJL99]
MRPDAILHYLYTNNLTVSTEQLMKQFDISSRTLSNDINLLNEVGENNGFKVNRVRGKGFQLEIRDRKKTELYLKENNPMDLLGGKGRNERVEIICLIMLMNEKYFTVKELTNLLNVSFSTIKIDMKNVAEYCRKFHLNLMRKAHYGAKIIGTERNKRKTIMYLQKKIGGFLEIKLEQYQQIDTIDEKELRIFVASKIREQHLKVNDLIFDELILNIKIQCVRLLNNFLLEKDEVNDLGEVDGLTKQISAYLETKYTINFSNVERNYLKELLQEKIVRLNGEIEKQEFKERIQLALEAIDSKYHTNFQQDTELSNALLVHMAPLIQRLNLKQPLENPIIESVYTRFTNVFNVSLDFIASFSQDLENNVTKDEIGYIAIYFAASLEKQSTQVIKSYQKIAVICTTGGGAAYLLKVNLQRLFSQAKIETFALNELNSIDDRYDLLISTVPELEKINRIPLIFIKDISAENELNKIEQDLNLLKESKKESIDSDQYLLELFDEQWFSIVEDEIEYLDLLQVAGERLEEEQWAKSGFTKSMLKREKLIDTIYRQGISGPHPMEQVAKKEVISVLLPTKKMMYQEKRVRIIFLINIKKNHLNLHKEISRLMIKMMEDPKLDEELTRIKNYESFMIYLKNLL